ncbi:hypothetical protein [Aeromicrobium sp. Leaf291]|uniref:hypothetical protein n=1 Tax=Aeromicrobium sp. Leaf291 TaxID=1736325 RepID=UPI0006F79DEA|nr:hypothetical protein [Aeromicrobium sp. Leaf291]KQP83758.1 hypothetical protein ASF35_01905 [Aeromicrobium sp. Leaf291]
MSADDNAPEQAREVEVVARVAILHLVVRDLPSIECRCGERGMTGTEWAQHIAEQVTAALAPIRAAERQEAAREVTEAWCDWLAAICFGIDFSTALPPPCSATDLAEAMHREDPSESVDIWALCVEDNTGQRFGPARADGVTGRRGT